MRDPTRAVFVEATEIEDNSADISEETADSMLEISEDIAAIEVVAAAGIDAMLVVAGSTVITTVTRVSDEDDAEADAEVVSELAAVVAITGTAEEDNDDDAAAAALEDAAADDGAPENKAEAAEVPLELELLAPGPTCPAVGKAPVELAEEAPSPDTTPAQFSED